MARVTISGRKVRNWGIERSYKHTIGAGITLHLSSFFGVSVRRMRGSDDRWYLCAIGWYPRSWNRLGHFQLSCRTI